MSPFDRAKRLLDLCLGSAGLVMTMPLQAALATAVAARLGRPVLFRQLRPGRDGVPFTMVKFRTMRPIDPRRGWTTDSTRLTPFGRWLRSTSLDELPTLWNVTRGEMSLVGPRPLLMQYLPLYSPTQARRHEVRPGITGLAQVSGRNEVDWSERLRLDVTYVDQRCLALDLNILLRTVGSVLGRNGISAAGEATMPEFTGAALIGEGR